MSILVAIFSLSLLILIHELGHYWMGRCFKVPVISFSVGIGPLIAKFRDKHGTSFELRALLLGGYVQFYNQQLQIFRLKSFTNFPLWQRTLIVLAGPVINLICAILIFMFLGMTGVPGQKPIMGEVPANLAAAEAGIREDDLILSVSNRPVYLWQDVVWLLLPKIGDAEIPISWQTPDDIVIHGQLDLAGYSVGDVERLPVEDIIGMNVKELETLLPAIIGEVSAGLPAARIGLLPGDEILAVNERPIETWGELVELISTSPNEPLELRVRRDSQIMNFRLVPESQAAEPGRGLAGIAAALPTDFSSIYATYFVNARYSLLDAWSYALRCTYDMLDLTAQTLYLLVSGNMSIQSISGPVGIVDVIGQAFNNNIYLFGQLLAIINLSLFFINLLPIPGLDGGHLFLYATESILRKKPHPRFVHYYNVTGFSLILFLFIIITFNDIVRLLA